MGGRASKRLKTGTGSSETSFREAFQLPVSRARLAGASEVFRRQLVAWKPAPGKPLVIEILPGEEALFRQLVQFIYTEELDPALTHSEAELWRMLLLANFYAVDGCAAKCASLLDKPDLSLQLAIEICNVASEQAHCQKLADRAGTRIMETFGDWDTVCGVGALFQQFLVLPYKVVQVQSPQGWACIGVVAWSMVRDDLRVMVEKTVFSMVMAWLRHQAAPAAQLGALDVRYAHMTTAYLKGVVAEEAMFKSLPQHVTILIDALAHKPAPPPIQQLNLESKAGICHPRQHYATEAVKSQTFDIEVVVHELNTLEEAKTLDTIVFAGYKWVLQLIMKHADRVGMFLSYYIHDGVEADCRRLPTYALLAGITFTGYKEGYIKDEKMHFSFQIEMPLPQ
ncbi:hypothetical protein WJX72_010546 [[Myrmecia] bisecta]|uniref:BTB domain-containing protein n=1 Tax=[Myrmecia] bisecta TaxID=41462 RepID=A0AAW1PTP4_9CHLO